MTDERERLRMTFNSAADSYQQARPEYPARLYDALLDLAELDAGDRVLEIGCASGKATIPLAQRGLRITCIEIGADLVTAARRNLAAFPDVQVVHGAFETWRSPDDQLYDLVFAATAWAWVDPGVRYARAAALLRPGGHLAFWSAIHVFPTGGDPFFAEIQEIYDEIGEARPTDATQPKPGDLPDSRAEIEQSSLFDRIEVRHFDWEVSYSADEYIALLNTFSGHIDMAAGQRDRLYSEIRARLAQRPDGRLRRHWGAVLHVSRRE